MYRVEFLFVLFWLWRLIDVVVFPVQLPSDYLPFIYVFICKWFLLWMYHHTYLYAINSSFILIHCSHHFLFIFIVIIYLLLLLSIYLFIYLSIYLSVHMSLNLFLRAFICTFMHELFCIFIHTLINFLFVNLFVLISFFFSIFIFFIFPASLSGTCKSFKWTC